MRNALAASMLLLAGCSTADIACHPPLELSDIPLMRFADREIIPVEIEAQPAGLLMDTGSAVTTVTPQAVRDFDLAASREIERGHGAGSALYATLEGVGGEGRYQAVDVGHLVIGGMQAQDVTALVVPLAKGGLESFPASGLLGQDFLGQWDIDLDVAHDRLTLYRAQQCADVAPPWGAAGAAASLRPNDINGKLVFPVTLDGRPLTAFLDTGANITSVRRDAVDLDASTLARDPSGHAVGINFQAVSARIHEFGHLEVAGVDYGGARAAVADFRLGDYDMLLGDDFLRHHRVFIASHAHKLFIARSDQPDPASVPPASP